MKKVFLTLIFTISYVVTVFSQENINNKNKTFSNIAYKNAVTNKSKSSKTHKKVKELRKKLACFQESSPFKKTLLLSKDERKENGLPPNKYYENEWELTINPSLGRPTPENLEVVRANIKRERQRLLASGRVPGDAVDNQWIERGPSNVGGRTRAIMFDPNDATRETVIAGGVSGGLWKNTAISSSNSQWTRINIPENLNISCIISDPNNTNIFYVGTGESYTSGDVGGDGVWKSVNRGLTWTKVLGGVTGVTSFQSAANVTINSPIGLAGNYPCFPNSSFGPTITSSITAPIILVTDGISVPTSLGCNALINATVLNNKIALVRRGSCNFSVKVANAQAAGAIAVIVMNNVAGPPAAMGGADATITIPSVMISREDGNLLEAALTTGTTINGTLNPSAVGVLSGNIVPGVQFINKIAIRNNNGNSEIYIAAADSFYGSSNATTYIGSDSYGVYKSGDGGVTWTLLVLPLTSNGNKHCPNDIEIGFDNKIWVASTESFAHSDGGGKVFCSSDGGATFQEKYTVTGNGGGARVEIEASAYNANTIYVLSQLNQATATSALEVKIIKTTDGFATSTVTALPAGNETRETTYGFTGAQAFYNLMIESDPTNDQIVYVGGIDLYRSINGCNSWTTISNWTSNVHSDQHAMTFKPGNSNIAIFGNDGGVYYAGNLATATSNSGITPRNNGFNVTQFYSIGVGPTTIGTGDYFTAGAQDNGSQYFAGVSSIVSGSSEVQGGDGAFCMFDQGTDNYYITNYIYNKDINYRSVAGVVRQISGSSESSLSNGAFICPMALDSNKDILFSDYTIPATATTPAVYGIRRYTNLKAGTIGRATISSALITNSPSALTVSKHNTASTTLLAGFKNGKVLLSANANTTVSTTVLWTDITSPDFVGSVSDVEFGNTENDIFVTFHNYNVVSIWYSSDRGVTWQNKEGNFPDIPVKCILQNPLKLNEVIIGTELGVWFTNSFNTTSPVWYQSFNGMSNVKVTDLDLRNDNAVYAATYGRGVFSGVFTAATLANEDFSNSKGVSIYPNPSNGQFNININQYSGKVNIQVADLNGREVYNVVNEKFNSEKAVNLQMLESGIYVLRISGEDLNYSQKIIKN